MQSEGNYIRVYICRKTSPDDFLLGKFLLGGAAGWVGVLLPLVAARGDRRGEERRQSCFLAQGQDIFSQQVV